MTTSPKFDPSVESWIPVWIRNISGTQKIVGIQKNRTRFYNLPGVKQFTAVYQRLKLEAVRFQDRYGEYDIELKGTWIDPPLPSPFIITLQKPSITHPRESVRANIALATIQIYDWAVMSVVDLPFNQGELFRWSDERLEAIDKVKEVFKHFGMEPINKETEVRIFAMLSNQDLNGYTVVSVEIKVNSDLVRGIVSPEKKYFQAMIRKAGKNEPLSLFSVNSTDGLLD